MPQKPLPSATGGYYHHNQPGSSQLEEANYQNQDPISDASLAQPSGYWINGNMVDLETYQFYRGSITIGRAMGAVMGAGVVGVNKWQSMVESQYPVEVQQLGYFVGTLLLGTSVYFMGRILHDYITDRRMAKT